MKLSNSQILSLADAITALDGRRLGRSGGRANIGLLKMTRLLSILFLLCCLSIHAQPMPPPPPTYTVTTNTDGTRTVHSGTNTVTLPKASTMPFVQPPPPSITYRAFPAAFQFAMLQFSTDNIWWKDVTPFRLDDAWRTNQLPTNRVGFYRIAYFPSAPPQNQTNAAVIKTVK